MGFRLGDDGAREMGDAVGVGGVLGNPADGRFPMVVTGRMRLCSTDEPAALGIVAKDGAYCLSILKSADGNPDCNHRFFYEYDAPIAGTGHFIHTYQENLDPLPSFEGEPRKVAINVTDAKSWAEELWTNLNEDNKVSLFVRTIDLATGETDTVIINKHC